MACYLDESWMPENLYVLSYLEQCGLSCLLLCKSLHQSKICSNRTCEGFQPLLVSLDAMYMMSSVILTNFVMA